MADFEDLVRSGDADAVLLMLGQLTEQERRALAPRSLALRRIHDVISGAQPLGPDVDEATRLAVYGTASLAELRAMSRIHALPPDRAADVLRLRPASFLVPWTDWFLEHYWDWDVVRNLVVEGLIPRPSTPWYVLRMLGRRSTSPSRSLLDDPALLDEEVWRLFEVEGSGELSLAAFDKYVAVEDSWQAALLAVASADDDHRQRLLDASLAALARDMAAFRASWFSRFHEALEPSPDERATRTGAYALLLPSPVRSTVSFAVRALEQVARAGRLPRTGVVERLGPALSEGPAGTARSALRMLERAVGADRSLSGVVAQTAVEALAHDVPEVQATALQLLERIGPPGDVASLTAIREQAGSVHASQRDRCERLVATWTAAIEGEGDPTAAVPAAGEGEGDPTAAVPAAITARPAADDGPPPQVRASRPADPLDPSRALTPIGDLDELVEVLAGVLETGGPADDIERALDAVSRSGRPQGDDFERRTAPLVKRAGTLQGRRWEHAGPRLDIACLILRWARAMPADPLPYRGLAAFLAARVTRVADRASAGIERPLLAAPTHRGGWIEPSVLVERLASWPPDEPPDELDAVQALLRLRRGPDDAELAMAMDLRGEVAEALRYALGGEAEIGPTAAIWAAAARARSPGADDPRVDGLHPDLGPDAGRAARFAFVTGEWRDVPGGLALQLEPAMPTSTRTDVPTVLLLSDEGWSAYEPRRDMERRRWEATVWPAWRESWFAVGAAAIGRNLDWWSAQWGNRVYLEPLLDRWTEVGPMARQLVGIALGAKEPGERGLAADATIVAIDDGRIDAVGLVEGLTNASELGLARPRRWAMALSAVATASERHARVVQEVAGRALVLPTTSAGDRVPLLRLTHELVYQTRRPLSQHARAGVATVSGRGAARRLADSIMSASERMSPDPSV